MYMMNVMAIVCVAAFLLDGGGGFLSTHFGPITLSLDRFAQLLGVSRLSVIFGIMLAMSLLYYLGNIAVILISQTPFFQKRQRRRLEELARELVAAEQSGEFNANR